MERALSCCDECAVDTECVMWAWCAEIGGCLRPGGAHDMARARHKECMTFGMTLREMALMPPAKSSPLIGWTSGLVIDDGEAGGAWGSSLRICQFNPRSCGVDRCCGLALFSNLPLAPAETMKEVEKEKRVAKEEVEHQERLLQNLALPIVWMDISIKGKPEGQLHGGENEGTQEFDPMSKAMYCLHKFMTMRCPE